MDEHARPAASTSSPPSPSSFFSGAGDGLVLEFPYTEVPEQWLMEYDDNLQDQPPLEHGAAAGSADLSSRNPPAATKRGRKKPGPSAGGGAAAAAISHVEAERHRRDKLHRRFCDLRAAVPNVTRMDKASLLADATTYIAELRRRVEQLEVEATRTRAAVRRASPFLLAGADDGAASAFVEEEEKLEVRMVAGRVAAALRLTTAVRHGRHATARLMDALRSLDLAVLHACACRVGGVTVQDAVVDVPAGELRDEGCLRAALLHRLQRRG